MEWPKGWRETYGLNSSSADFVFSLFAEWGWWEVLELLHWGMGELTPEQGGRLVEGENIGAKALALDAATSASIPSTTRCSPGNPQHCRTPDRITFQTVAQNLLLPESHQQESPPRSPEINLRASSSFPSVSNVVV